jgi:hypothetical protein
VRPRSNAEESRRGAASGPLFAVDPASPAVPRRFSPDFLDGIPACAPLNKLEMLVIHDPVGGPSMSHGVLEIHEGRPRPDGFDPDEFARSVRRFAHDAYDVLGRPDSRLGELIGLHGRAFHLLEGVRGTPGTGILSWLMAVQQRIGTRLQSWSVEDLESRVA